MRVEIILYTVRPCSILIWCRYLTTSCLTCGSGGGSGNGGSSDGSSVIFNGGSNGGGTGM